MQDLEDQNAALAAEIAYHQLEKGKAIQELTSRWQDEQRKVAGKQHEIEILHEEMAQKDDIHSEAIQTAKMKATSVPQKTNC
jgi:hypothetical protein